MRLRDYIDLYVLLEDDRSSSHERRAFGLKHETLKDDPVAQLRVWVAQHRSRLHTPLLSEQVEGALYSVTLVLAAVALGLGILSGIGLLSYSGKEPVNLVYFLAMVVFLPLVTMGLSVIAMLRAKRSRNLLVHISPAFWMERLLSLIGHKEKLTDLHINPKLANWIIIRRSQMLALAFSIGLLVALLGVVVTHDIAFAWSTTLDLSAVQFHRFVTWIALPWREWLPQAVPSLELVSQSHYYRLGGKLHESMVAHAALLGTWWKFLAMATLFYAVLLRTLFYLIATWGYRSALKEAFLTLNGATLLLKEMNEPLVTTRSAQPEQDFVSKQHDYTRIIQRLDERYDGVQGWSIPIDLLRTVCDTLHVDAEVCVETGGNNTLEEDEAIARESHGSVMFVVKAWEPPTMDFIDYLSMLSQSVKSVVVVPIGTPQTGFTPDHREVEVWLRKIASLEKENIWVKV